MTCLLACGCQNDPAGTITFVGDVMLGRGVAAEMSSRGSPWENFDFAPGDAWVGNLEGALAEGECTKDPALCLGFSHTELTRLRDAPFVAMSLANNHADDYGSNVATADALTTMGIRPLVEGSPTVMEVAGLSFAFVPLDLTREPLRALESARLTIGLARASTPWVVVLPHWGAEGMADLAPGQAAAADMFAAWGARLVVGAHAHVVQPAACTPTSAVWYGLGDHLFDQHPTETHTGGIVRCTPRDGGLDCVTGTTHRTERSTFPVPDPVAAGTCHLDAPLVTDLSWRIHPWRDSFAFVQPFPAAGEGAWFAIHRRWSDLDDAVALRPYVFRIVGDHHEDVWRGTSLSRPLVAAQLFESGGESLLCAIERGDSFLAPDPETTERIREVYRWTGFGFRVIDDAAATRRCDAM